MSAASDVLAEALDGTASGLLEDTETLLVIVDRLYELPGSTRLAGAAARPDFRAELRARLLEEAGREHEGADRGKVIPLTSRWNQSWGRRNRLRILSGIAAGIVALAAVSIAAADSLPGNPFYQLKRGSESVQYALAGSDEARGKLELGFARTRLHEIDRLTQHDAAYGILPTDTPQAAGASNVLAASLATKVVRLFADMDAETAKGSQLLARSYAQNPRPGPLLAVQQFAKDQQKALTSLRGRLVGPALSKATHSLAWANLLVKSTTEALAKCSGSTCPAPAANQFGGSVVPSLGPSMPPSTGPSAGAPASQVPLTPSPLPGASSTAPGPSGAVPTLPVTSPQPTTAQPTGGQPTDTPSTTDQPTTPPTGAPTTDQSTTPTTPTTEASPSTTPTSPVPPTDPEPSPSTSTGTTPPPTTTSPVVDTTPPPPSTVPPTTPVPSITPVPTTAPPATSAATLPAAPPITTITAPRHGRPPKTCVPPSVKQHGKCTPPTGGAAVL